MAPLANAAAFSSMSHFFRNPIMPAAQNLWLLVLVLILAAAARRRIVTNHPLRLELSSPKWVRHPCSLGGLRVAILVGEWLDRGFPPNFL
jgi:hypothetical protein